jgi:hypothetical protein
MYVLEESDCAVLPMKLPNKEAKASAEAAEGRARTKENDVQHHTYPTQSGIRVSQGLGGVRRTEYGDMIPLHLQVIHLLQWVCCQMLPPHCSPEPIRFPRCQPHRLRALSSVPRRCQWHLGNEFASSIRFWSKSKTPKLFSVGRGAWQIRRQQPIAELELACPARAGPGGA